MNLLQRETLASTQSMENWTNYLDAAARNFKYNFGEQLLINSQKPGATAIADYDVWKNRLGRVVKTGTAMYLPVVENGKPKVKNYFDIEDTIQKHISSPIPQWGLSEENQQAVLEHLAANYDLSEPGEMFEIGSDLENALNDIYGKSADSYSQTNIEAINTALEGIGQHNSNSDLDDKYTRELAFETVVYASVAIIVNKRLGIGNKSDTNENFLESLIEPYLHHFNTEQSIIALGNAVSSISEECLRNVETAVKGFDREQLKIRRERELDEQRVHPGSNERDDLLRAADQGRNGSTHGENESGRHDFQQVGVPGQRRSVVHDGADGRERPINQDAVPQHRNGRTIDLGAFSMQQIPPMFVVDWDEVQHDFDLNLYENGDMVAYNKDGVSFKVGKMGDFTYITSTTSITPIGDILGDKDIPSYIRQQMRAYRNGQITSEQVREETLQRLESYKAGLETPVANEVTQSEQIANSSSEQSLPPDTQLILENKHYDLSYAHLGNGLTVANRLEEDGSGDYVELAHIDFSREISWRSDNLPEDVKAQIEQVAATSNARYFINLEIYKERGEWLDMIHDVVSVDGFISTEDFRYTPFDKHGGLGKFAQLFGIDDYERVLNRINKAALPQNADELHEVFAKKYPGRVIAVSLTANFVDVRNIPAYTGLSTTVKEGIFSRRANMSEYGDLLRRLREKDVSVVTIYQDSGAIFLHEPRNAKAREAEQTLTLSDGGYTLPKPNELAENKHTENIDGIDFVFTTVKDAQQLEPEQPQTEHETLSPTGNKLAGVKEDKRRNAAVPSGLFARLPDKNINADIAGKYSDTHFRIGKNGYDGSGREDWNENTRIAYENEVSEILTANGWDVHKSERSGVSSTATKGRNHLYLHSQDFSGVCENFEREKLFEAFKDAETFDCRSVDVYREIFDMTDEELTELLNSARETIENELLEAFTTKRSNLYISSVGYFGVDGNVGKRHSVKRLAIDGKNSHNGEDRRTDGICATFASDVFKSLVDSGKIVSSNTKSGIGYRSANKKEIERLQLSLAETVYDGEVVTGIPLTMGIRSTYSPGNRLQYAIDNDGAVCISNGYFIAKTKETDINVIANLINSRRRRNKLEPILNDQILEHLEKAQGNFQLTSKPHALTQGDNTTLVYSDGKQYFQYDQRFVDVFQFSGVSDGLEMYVTDNSSYEINDHSMVVKNQEGTVLGVVMPIRVDEQLYERLADVLPLDVPYKSPLERIKENPTNDPYIGKEYTDGKDTYIVSKLVEQKGRMMYLIPTLKDGVVSGGGLLEMPDGMEKRIALWESNRQSHERQLAENEAKAEKEAADRVIYENTHGFADNQPPMQKARTLDTLNNIYYTKEYGRLSTKDFITAALKDGKSVEAAQLLKKKYHSGDYGLHDYLSEYVHNNYDNSKVRKAYVSVYGDRDAGGDYAKFLKAEHPYLHYTLFHDESVLDSSFFNTEYRLLLDENSFYSINKTAHDYGKYLVENGIFSEQEQYPSSIQNDELLRDLYDNSGKNEELAHALYNAFQDSKMHGYQSNIIKQRRIKAALHQVVSDNDEVERYFKIIAPEAQQQEAQNEMGNIQEETYLLQVGDEIWLDGVKRNIQNMGDYNGILTDFSLSTETPGELAHFVRSRMEDFCDLLRQDERNAHLFNEQQEISANPNIQVKSAGNELEETVLAAETPEIETEDNNATAYQGNPLWQDYQTLADQHSGNILFYRVGDFYEVLGENTQTVSNTLDIAITARDVGLTERVPMCGIPSHKLDEYVNALRIEGFAVVIRHGADNIETNQPDRYSIYSKETAISPTAVIAGFVKSKLEAGEKFTSTELYAEATKAYGDTMANNAFTPKDAYDAMELGVNQYILSLAHVLPEDMLNMIDLLPTQTRRTADMEKFQQFSTPPSIAYLANWAANINANDIMIEPSAGIGGIAVFAKKDGAKVYVNELDKRRLEIIKSLPFDGFFNEDAEQINNIYGGKIEPTVIVMNPPFSSSAERNMYGSKIGAKHIEEALKLLVPNGRLVSVVGQSMADDAPAFRSWWKGIKEQYNVKANIGIDGKNYNKYGTSFGIQMLVIDKTGATTEPVKTTFVENLLDVQNILGGIRNDRPSIQFEHGNRNEQDPVATTHLKSVSEREPERKPSEPVSDASSGHASAVSGDRQEQAATSEIGTVVGRTTGIESEAANVSTHGSAPNVNTGRHRGNDGRDDVDNGTDRTGVIDNGQSDRSSQPLIKPVKKELTDSIFENYEPQSLLLENVQPHPANISESAAMSAIQPPPITYKPNLNQDLIDNGVLSDVQLEAVTYAGQSHSQILPNGNTRGFFLGDGTGVGKGRTITGVILDNYRQGRKKAVWLSENTGLVPDAKRDVTALFGNSDLVTEFKGGKNANKSLSNDESILFVTYSALSKGYEHSGSNYEKIVNWLGEDFDGVIVFDESHNMANATASKGNRGIKKASQRGMAGLAIQEALPKAKIVYSSATGATEVENLRYAERLGLWGEGTAFLNGEDFVYKIKAGGLAAMELIARDMKAAGVYLSRNISYEEVAYDKIVHELTPEQRQIYGELAQSWQIVLQNVNKALETTNQEKDGMAKGKAYSAFWGAQQRFFNQILTAMQVPSMITDIQKQLDDGNSIVIQLVSTNESAQEREFARLQEQDLDLEDFDLTPKQMLMSYIEHSFPTIQFETYEDDNGNKRSKPVYDSEGKAVINREAVRQKEELLDKLGSIKVPSSALDMIINHFGSDMVAENTGRKRRVVVKDGKAKEENIANKKQADVSAFQEGDKRIIIFSKAGGTGKSYHADKSAKNQQHRVHYLLQAGWQADAAVQGFGRSHRSNQVSAPSFVLVTTDLKGQMRFISTIAKRLDQLGALTKGQRQTGSQGLFTAGDNLENAFAADVLAMYYKTLIQNRVEGISDGISIIEKLGLKHKLTDEYGSFVPNAPELREVNKFLNRILTLECHEQNAVFDGYAERLHIATEKAMQDGTLDKGLENYRADKVVLNETHDIRIDENTGAATKYYNLTAFNKIKPLQFEDVNTQNLAFMGFYQNENTGAVRAAFQTSSMTDEHGNIIENCRLTGQDGSEYIPKSRLENNWEKLEKADELWNKAVSELPEFRQSNLHLIGGTVLPVWDKLPTENVRIYRVLTSDGDMLIGRVIPEAMIDATLEKLGATREKDEIETEDLIRHIKSGDTVYLDNDWRIVQKRVSNEQRIEVIGADYLHSDILAKKGVFTERIGYQTRYFIPAETDTAKILDEVIKISPVSRVEKNKERISAKPDSTLESHVRDVDLSEASKHESAQDEVFDDEEFEVEESFSDVFASAADRFGAEVLHDTQINSDVYIDKTSEKPVVLSNDKAPEQQTSNPKTPGIFTKPGQPQNTTSHLQQSKPGISLAFTQQKQKRVSGMDR